MKRSRQLPDRPRDFCFLLDDLTLKPYRKITGKATEMVEFSQKSSHITPSAATA